MLYPAATLVFLALIAVVIVLGFTAARWNAGNMEHIEEWGLGGRRFGTWVSWFLIGGDAYTAYTFIAIPALMFGAGAVGFFAMPYTVLIYPIDVYKRQEQDAAGQSEAEDVQHFEREQSKGDADDGGAGDAVPDGAAALLRGEAVDGEADDHRIVAGQDEVDEQDLQEDDEEGE